LAWARNNLKRDGILENSSRAVWALTEKGRNVQEVNPKELWKRISAEKVVEKPNVASEPNEFFFGEFTRTRMARGDTSSS
jgi:restriction system protein